MTDSSSISRQGFQPPIAQTFQPGRNVDQRTEREAIRQSDSKSTENNSGAAAETQGSQVNASEFQALPEPGKTENNPSAQRGSIVNIEV